MTTTVSRLAVAAAVALAVPGVLAQPQVVKPPQAQAWIDVATFTGFGVPMGGPGGGNPMAALGGLFGGGGGGAKNVFGNTQMMTAGRWVDVTLYSRTQPALAEAEQAVPAGFQPSALKLQPPKEVRTAPDPGDDKVVQHDVERPRGRLLLYWGCGPAVRAGQPKVLDMASASAADLARFFQSRRATQRGAHSAAGRPVWPSPADARMVPANASLVGQHGFTAPGVPASFRFQIPAAQDLMPALAVQQQAAADGSTELTWTALPTARAYFVAGMGANAKEEMVIWTSSEQPDTGFGLTDYQTNSAVDRWLGEKVLLAPSTTSCTVPAGIFPKDGGGMLRMIAYGHELNLVHPPRPQDPKLPWEQEWALKVRVKSVASLMLGMPDGGMGGMSDAQPSGEGGKPAPKKEKEDSLIPKPADLLRGILGR